MKKMIISSVLIFLLVFTGCSSDGKKKEQKKLGNSFLAENYAPANSLMLLKFSSVAKLFKTFNIGDESLIGKEMSGEKEEFKKVMGFDPTVLAEYEKTGLDVNKEFGFVLTDLIVKSDSPDKTQGNFGILFPVSSKDKAYNYIKEKLEENKTDDMQITDSGNILTLKSKADEEVFVTISADDNYLIFNLSVNMNGTVKKFMDKTGRLAETADYKEVAETVDMGSDGAFFMNMKSFFTTNKKALGDLSANPMFANTDMKSIDFLTDMRGFGMTGDLSSPDLIINSVAFIDKNSRIHKMIKGAVNNKSGILGFKEKPAMLISMLINASEYLNFFLNTMPEESRKEFDNNIAQANQAMGIDIRKDIIDQLAGSVNFGIYDGKSINMMQYNSVLNFNIKNRDKFVQLIDKTSQMSGLIKMDKLGAAEKIEGKTIAAESDISSETIELLKKSDIYSLNAGMMMVYMIIDEKTVSILTKPQMISDLLNKDNGSFTGELDKELSSKLNNDQNYFYLDADGTYAAFKNFIPLLGSIAGNQDLSSPEIDNFVRKFDYLYTGGNIEGEKAESEFIIKTRFKKPFFISITEEIEKLQKAE